MDNIFLINAVASSPPVEAIENSQFNENNIMFILSIISFIFGVIGVIGIYFTIRSYIDQKKTSKSYKALLEQANKDWIGKYTSEEIDRLNAQLGKLTEQINTSIPRTAEIVLLQHKAKNIENEITRLVREHKKIQSQIKKHAPQDDLAPEIMNYIRDEVDKKLEGGRNTTSFFVALIFFLLSIPMINERFYYYISELIWILNANLDVGIVTTYALGIVLMTFCVLKIRLKKFSLWVLGNKIKAILLSVFLFVVWGMLMYFLSYDILIVGFILQSIVGVISLFIFALDIKIIKTLFTNLIIIKP